MGSPFSQTSTSSTQSTPNENVGLVKKKDKPYQCTLIDIKTRKIIDIINQHFMHLIKCLKCRHKPYYSYWSRNSKYFELYYEFIDLLDYEEFLEPRVVIWIKEYIRITEPNKYYDDSIKKACCVGPDKYLLTLLRY